MPSSISSLDAKVVVITGASSGIGAALAEELGRRDASLMLVARRRPQLEEVTGRSGKNAQFVVADVTDREQVRHVVRESVSRFGRVDVWVNNAGQGITRMPTQTTDEDIDEMIRVNVKTVLYGMQEILPHFQERGTGQIVNVSSMLGRIPWVPFRAAYTGAKHFLNALTANFRDEVAQKHPGIHISLVSPGIVRTDFGLNARGGGGDSRAIPDSQSAEEVAIVIADVIASPRPDVYTRAGGHDRVIKYFDGVGTDP